MTSRSVQSATRANSPSNRSWLSSALSGTRSSQRALEGIDVVDALADVAAFAEEILIHVGHGGRVRVEADVPRKHFSENVDAAALTAPMATRG